MSKLPPRALPGPDERRTADVVIYDGACRLCRVTARWLDRLDRRSRLAFLPFQDPRVGQRWPDLSPEELESHMYVIDTCNRRHKGAEAAQYLTRRLPILWGLVPVLHFPGTKPVWEWLYHQISRRRHCRNCGE